MSKIRNNIVMKNINDLKPYPKNNKKHPQSQIDLLIENIKEFGFNVPILCDNDDIIVAGHGRLLAAQSLKYEQIPCLLVDDLTEAQIKALRIADNRIAELAETDWDNLKLEIGDLTAIDYDISLTGYDLDELGLNDDIEEKAAPDDPEQIKTDIVIGEMWQLGDHRLMCGDSTIKENVDKLMDGSKADMVFTDPPYGINIVGKNGKIGADNLAKNQSYNPIIADDTTETAKKSFDLFKDYSKNQMIWGGNYFINWLPFSVNWFIWDKRGEMTSNNFADGEMVWCSFKTPVRIFKQIWNGMIREGENDKKKHPTQKPIKIHKDMLEKAPKSNVILDLFGGSGSTLIAAEQLKRKCYMMELDPQYCQVIINRWEKLTGKKASKL